MANIWSRLADLPLFNSTCVSLCGHLLAIGGETTTDYSSDSTKAAIYAYKPTTNSWEVISQMSVARCRCFGVTLSATNELMVVGGNEGFSGMDSVEFASVI